MRIARIITYWFVALAVWLLLSWDVGLATIVSGVVFGLIAALWFGSELPIRPARLLNPVRWFWVLVYIPVFAWECFKANIDVAMRVLSPGLMLRPGIVKIRTTLKSEIARAFLANSITMTPGTMTVEIQDDVLYIHWIDVKTDDPQLAGKIIKGPFEKLLARIFD